MSSKWLLFIALYTLFIDMNGQTVSFQYLSKKEGLSQSSVFAIVQDADGFMWFGTRDGLNKYDGYQFKVYRKDTADSNSLIGNDIRSLFADTLYQQLWIATSVGLSEINSVATRSLESSRRFPV